MDSEGKYISLVLKKFYNEKEIVIEFTLPYMLKQNFVAKQSQYTLDCIKDAIIVDSKFLKQFQAKAMTIATYLKNLLSTTFRKKVLEEL